MCYQGPKRHTEATEKAQGWVWKVKGKAKVGTCCLIQHHTPAPPYNPSPLSSGHLPGPAHRDQTCLWAGWGSRAQLLRPQISKTTTTRQ